MTKKKSVKTLVDQLNLVIEGKEFETVVFDVDNTLMVHIPPKVKCKLIEAVRLNPDKAERLVRIANMVDVTQLEYTLDKNLY